MLGVEYPIIQAGMVWASGWRLCSAVSNAGALGVIGSGSMYPHILEERIIKCMAATNKPFAVNIPILYSDIEHHLEIVIRPGLNRPQTFLFSLFLFLIAL